MACILHLIVDCSGSMHAWHKHEVALRLVHNLLLLKQDPSYAQLQQARMVLERWDEQVQVLTCDQTANESTTNTASEDLENLDALSPSAQLASVISQASTNPWTEQDMPYIALLLKPVAQSSDLAKLAKFIYSLPLTLGNEAGEVATSAATAEADANDVTGDTDFSLEHKLILFTDGHSKLPTLDATNENIQLKLPEHVALSVVGLGPDLNESNLTRLSPSQQYFTPVDFGAVLDSLELGQDNLPDLDSMLQHKAKVQEEWHETNVSDDDDDEFLDW